MRKHINWDKVVAAASWFIVVILVYGVVFILVHDLNPASPIVHALGETTTRVVFVSMYAAQGILLGYAKMFHKNTLRRHVLLSIYLAGFFLAILGAILNGFTVRLVANFLVSTLAAVCWLYWKFRMDYLSHDEVRELRAQNEQSTG